MSEHGPPLGLQVARTAKTLSRAFDAALTEAGGNVPTWLILLAVKTGRAATQRELAAQVGIEGATLTHHLAGLEHRGLVARERSGRIQRVSLTADGETAFRRLRKAAQAHDAQLRSGLSDADQQRLRALLAKLEANAG